MSNHYCSDGSLFSLTLICNSDVNSLLLPHLVIRFILKLLPYSPFLSLTCLLVGFIVQIHLHYSPSLSLACQMVKTLLTLFTLFVTALSGSKIHSKTSPPLFTLFCILYFSATACGSHNSVAACLSGNEY